MVETPRLQAKQASATCSRSEPERKTLSPRERARLQDVIGRVEPGAETEGEGKAIRIMLRYSFPHPLPFSRREKGVLARFEATGLQPVVVHWLRKKPLSHLI